MAHNLSAVFTAPLVDLGQREDARFVGVLTPEPEVGAARLGVTAEFLENAEEYYQRHQGFDHWRATLRDVTALLGIGDPRTIIEYGCGFGNSTLPLLDLFPSADVVAMDISPNLLAILQRLTKARSYDDRCVAVAMDAHKPYIKSDVADLVVGTAILHHLVHPEKLIEAAVRVLKPNGCAIFFEPFEAGYAVLRLIIRDICREAAIHEFRSPALTWLAEMSAIWLLQIKRDKLPGWQNLDDKWMFCRPYLQEIADSVDADLTISQSVNSSIVQQPLRHMLNYILKHWRGLDPDDQFNMPAWAWAVVDQYENEYFSPKMKEDLLFAGTIVFKKR
ncbi:class I SAM-dependent methyltransferase [Achromobacter aegrifaciens]